MEGDPRARILVVDDDEPFCGMIRRMLEKGHCCSESTTSPLEALAKLHRRSYDIVISDIVMEEKNGLELMREGRSLHPHVDFIMMTGHADRHAYSDIIDAGAKDFIAKPFASGELLAKIKRIRKEKQWEMELQEHRDRLEDLVKIRTGELTRANALLREQIADKENIESSLRESETRVRQLNENILHMLMIMSHDIRGPLVAMAATAKLLLRGFYGDLGQSVGNTVKDLLTRIVRVIGIAEDCLGKAHAVDDSMRMDREMVDLRQDIIDPVLDEIFHDLENYHIRIDNRLGSIPAGAIPIKANKTWLKAVFRNLFKNAIKYGGHECTIAYGFEDQGACYRLNVYNSGNPVPEEYRNKLFTKFGRISGSGHEVSEGIGLGLYLIREIVRKHGGDIWYEAKPNGSDFVFTILKE